ncbi:MAG: hypothetical protein QXD45_06050 [Candidatus Bathyarchaeia archaeon]
MIMDNFEEALKNIDVFCKVLAEKIVENFKKEECKEANEIPIEPMERLLRRKYNYEERFESARPVKCFIPLPNIEEPLIDVFEDDSYVRVLVQCRCRDHRVTLYREFGGLQICLEDECWRISLPIEHLQIENMVMKCNNNEALEVEIPKLKAIPNIG